MHNFGRRARVRAATVAIWLLISAVAEAQTARSRYESAAQRETNVRVLLTNHTTATAPADLIAQVTQVMTAFEILVRRFPASGYADNALFQAASLADTTYEKFLRPQDRSRAIRYYEWLVKEYPTSSFVKRASARLESFSAAVPSTPGTQPEPPPPSPHSATREPPAVLASIERTVTEASVRVTIALDREVRYLEQR